MNASALTALLRPFERLRGSVMPRLFAIVLAFSCLVTLLLTAAQLYRDYRSGVALIGERLSDVDRSYRASLAEALWRLDREQLQLELDGIARLPDISVVEVRERASSPVVVTAGQRGKGEVLARDFPIVRPVAGALRTIGTLHVEATLDDLYRQLKRTAIVILVSQAANTFLVALFVTFVLDWLVMRHLTALARKVDRYDFRVAPHPLALDRPPPRIHDELERVVAAFNAMGARLHRAYLDERDAASEREARHAAEAANHAKSAFIASMSHELRTPLNGILGYAQILARDNSLADQQREAISVIMRCGEHLLALIHDVLDFATIEAGKLRVDIGEVAPAAVMGAIHGAIAVKAADKGLAFQCEIASDAPPSVYADERRLRQVLLNLLTNAVKFTAHGTVALHVTRTASGGARFAVSDTGIGVPEQQLERIFHPFEQAVRPDARDGGIGLGLAISRQFARAMGAEIEVESKPGEGSIFSFELPAVVEAKARGGIEAGIEAGTQIAAGTAVQTGIHSARRALSGDGGRAGQRIVVGYEGARRRVLVVDDVDVNRDVVAELLGRVGFDVATAGSVAEADANIEQSEFCLVLTDVVMPGSDGLEWIRRLRASARHRSLPVIAMSASSFQADIEKGLAAGADAFVGKPIDFERLFVEIAGVLGLRWRYQASADGAADCPPCDLERLLQDRLPTPGGRQMDELHCLARMGDMRGARRWAEATAASNARFAPFAATVVALAQAYRSKQLLAFVERHLGPRGES